MCSFICDHVCSWSDALVWMLIIRSADYIEEMMTYSKNLNLTTVPLSSKTLLHLHRHQSYSVNHKKNHKMATTL